VAGGLRILGREDPPTEPYRYFRVLQTWRKLSAKESLEQHGFRIAARPELRRALVCRNCDSRRIERSSFLEHRLLVEDLRRASSRSAREVRRRDLPPRRWDQCGTRTGECPATGAAAPHCWPRVRS